jgi:hypothetical protein
MQRSLLIFAAFVACRPAPESANSASSKTAVASAPGKGEPGVAAACAPGTEWRFGPYRYVNDQWGSNKARGPFEQCLLKRDGTSGAALGWSWSWPGVDTSVFAYPSATFGWKPWVGGESTYPGLPLRVGDIARLELSYDVATDAQGSYNLAPEVWLVRERPASNAQNPQLISRELMFWLDYAGVAAPAGQVVDTKTIDDKTYEVWREDNIGKEANGVGWQLLSFKSRTRERRGIIKMHEFLKYLLEQRLLDPNEFVASVEFGNEIMGGQGTTWIKHLGIEVEPARPPGE